MRNVILEILVADLLEQIMKNNRTRNPISVIVTEYDNFLAFLDRLVHTSDGLIHILHEKRIVSMSIVIRGKKSLNLLLALNAAMIEQSRNYVPPLLTDGILHRKILSRNTPCMTMVLMSPFRDILSVWKTAYSAK